MRLTRSAASGQPRLKRGRQTDAGDARRAARRRDDCGAADAAVGLGSVLGYLLAGVAIGPPGCGLVTDVDADRRHRQPRRGHAAVPDRAGAAAAAAVGDAARGVRAGTAQVVFSAARCWRRWRMRPGSPGRARSVLGAGLAMSSTAIVLPMLAERDLLQAERDATGSRCCCSRTWPSSRWSRWCRCWRSDSCRTMCRGTMWRARRWWRSPSSWSAGVSWCRR